MTKLFLTLPCPAESIKERTLTAGHGQMKREQLEIAQLKAVVAKLKAERNIVKKAAACCAKEST